MGYEGERATSASLKRLMESGAVKDRLAQLTQRAQQDEFVAPPSAKVAASAYLPEYVFGIDGSLHPLPIENGYPGAELCFHSVVAVALKIAELRELDKRRAINPVFFRDIQDVSAYETVLSGTNVVRAGFRDARSTFRSYLHDSLGEKGVVPEDETLLQTYEHLLKNRQTPDEMKCPYKGDCGDVARRFVRNVGTYICGCPEKRTLYSTDALDIHSSLSETGTSGRMYGEAQMVLEHLWLLNIIRALIRSKPTKRTMDRIAFVMDGPLRVDGEPAWLSWCIRDELMRLNKEVVDGGGKDLLIIGIEKTGAFTEHLQLLDTQLSGSPDRLPKGTIYLLSNEYIRRNIAPGPYGPKDAGNPNSAPHNPYGYQTYYGRKFFYKTATGALICGHIPFLRPDDRDAERADPSQYARLEDALSILDKLGSARYPNAIIPVIAAHAETAIPLVQGRKVLEMLARDETELLNR
jgi:hypothetical protein